MIIYEFFQTIKCKSLVIQYCIGDRTQDHLLNTDFVSIPDPTYPGNAVFIEEILHDDHIHPLGVACLAVLEANAVGTKYLSQG